MARFEPFTGLRYSRSLPLGRLVAPPYDVVGAEERAELASRHRANAIHVELPSENRAEGIDRYSNAARLLRAWMEEGVVVKESRAAFYGYRMTPPAGASTTGVIGALGCEGPDGDVLPHEQTMRKDTTDRLDLLRACRANTSPVWGLSLTTGLATLYEPEGDPDADVLDDDGVRHELWVVEGADATGAIREAVGSSPVVIADGHHRYQTALDYQAERRSARDGVSGSYDLVMALVVELSEEQLTVGPIHRTIAGPVSPQVLHDVVGRFFETVDAGPLDDEMVATVVRSGALALVTREGIWLLTPRNETYEAAGSDLDSSLVALTVEAIPGAETNHHHSWYRAVEAVRKAEAEAAMLLRPVTVEQIKRWAEARRRMPPKSTYFWPKPRTGMVYRPLDD